MAAATAWLASGAGMMPSARANWMPAAKASNCCTVVGFGQSQIDDMRNQRRHAVIAQPAGMDSGRNERAAQGVHLHQRGQVAGIAEVIGKAALGQAGASGRFDGNHARAALALELAADVRHHEAGKIRSAAGAADDHVRIVAGQRHLLNRFLADHGLVQQHVIQHAAQRVLGVGILGGHFHSL